MGEEATFTREPRSISRADLFLGCVLSSLLSIGASLFVGDFLIKQREAAFRASIPKIVTVDEKELLRGFLSAPAHEGKSDEEFEEATLDWARSFQAISDQIAARNNLIVLRRSNVAAGAEDITGAVSRGLYGE